MISAIIYGRNDNYSYELNRRTALGLNQLARQLDPDRDEIVFVDYATDDDLPTHAEAIADTLTRRAIGLIRVIRVRPSFHASQPPEGPPVREAICRNIALRRLSPGTDWVLSTNPDCLLIAVSGPPLSAITPALPPGYYGLPRFELPRLIWEALPRSDPDRAAAETLTLAHALQLEERVSHYLPSVGYDAPGDFQLARAEDLAAIAGFDERMTQGWHVDSNMNARLALQYGALSDLNEAAGSDLRLFHAEHARRASTKHGAGRAEDPFETFVEQIADEIPLGQAESWGAPDETFEEFPLAAPPAQIFLKKLATGCAGGPSAAYAYGPESFGTLPRGQDLDDHLFAFLVDHLAYAPPDAAIGWFGDDTGRAARFAQRMQAAGLANPIHVAIETSEIDATLQAADLLILDAGADLAPVAETAFAAIIRAEHARRAANKPPRRVIGLNVPHGAFEAPFLTFIPTVMAPVATRIRFGEVAAPDIAPIDLMTAEDQAATGPGEEGYVAIRRRALLPPGHWRLDYEIRTGLSRKGRAVIDIALDGEPAGDAVLSTGLPGARTGSITFESGANGMFGGGMECRLWTDGTVKAHLTAARLTPLQDEIAPH
ncbi:MAG: hypothetical protein P8Q48_24070 [Paracoccaceae bacterium]|nr:hypothetical protein [Paracoccaceae bacterium]